MGRASSKRITISTPEQNYIWESDSVKVFVLLSFCLYSSSRMLLNHSKKTLKVGGFSRYAYDRENSRLSVTLNKQYCNETSDLLSLGKSIQDVILRKSALSGYN